MPLRLLLMMTVILVASCGSTKDSVDPTNEQTPARAGATRAWELVDSGRTVGIIVRFDEAASDRFFFSVRNELHQELGLIDNLGRAWRFRPHEDEEWIGTGSVEDGARRILGVSETASLVEVSLPAPGS